MHVRRILAVAGLAAMAAVAPAQAQRDYGITVNNFTRTPIEYLRFTACRSPWGPDRLGNSELIEPSRSRFFDMYIGIPDCGRSLSMEPCARGSMSMSASSPSGT